MSFGALSSRERPCSLTIIIGSQKKNEELLAIEEWKEQEGKVVTPADETLPLFLSFCDTELECRLVCKKWKKAFESLFGQPNIVNSLQPSKAPSWRVKRSITNQKRSNFLSRVEEEKPEGKQMETQTRPKSIAVAPGQQICEILSASALTPTLQRVITEVTNERIYRITTELSQQYLREDKSRKLAEIFKGCEFDDIAMQKQSFNPLFQRMFPNKKLSIWSYQDKAGEVYGWPDKVHLFILGPIDDPVIVKICLTCTKAHVMLFYRKLSLYGRKTGKLNTKKVLILCGSMDDSAIRFATQKGYTIQILCE